MRAFEGHRDRDLLVMHGESKRTFCPSAGSSAPLLRCSSLRASARCSLHITRGRCLPSLHVCWPWQAQRRLPAPLHNSTFPSSSLLVLLPGTVWFRSQHHFLSRGATPIRAAGVAAEGEDRVTCLLQRQ